MKIVFLTNNNISIPLIDWIKEREKDVFVCNNKIDLQYINKINPDIIISYNYNHLIKKDIIDRMNNKIINLHISLLPWNRGSYPNFWSFIENTTKGVSIIIIDEGIDTGKILFNKELEFCEENETFYTSYIKLHEEIQKLFKSNWGNIKKWNVQPVIQNNTGSVNYDKNFDELVKKIPEFDWNMNIKEFKEKYSYLIKEDGRCY